MVFGLCDALRYCQEFLATENQTIVTNGGNAERHKSCKANTARYSQSSEEIFNFPGEHYGTGFFIRDEKLIVLEGKTENVFEKDFNSGESTQSTISGLSKRNATLAPDGKHLLYRVEENLKICNLETREIIFEEEFMKFRQLVFEGDKCIIGSETGQVYVFNWG